MKTDNASISNLKKENQAITGNSRLQETIDSLVRKRVDYAKICKVLKLPHSIVIGQNRKRKR